MKIEILHFHMKREILHEKKIDRREKYRKINAAICKRRAYIIYSAS